MTSDQFKAWIAQRAVRPHCRDLRQSRSPAENGDDGQGRGIGSMLLADYCDTMDQTGMLSYLETDKPENVRLYERFGYTVAAEADVIGIASWFMTREPTQPTGR